jgi:hypothetical protein
MNENLEVVEESDGQGGYVYVIKLITEGIEKTVYYESADKLSDKFKDIDNEEK